MTVLGHVVDRLSERRQHIKLEEPLHGKDHAETVVDTGNGVGGPKCRKSCMR